MSVLNKKMERPSPTLPSIRSVFKPNTACSMLVCFGLCLFFFSRKNLIIMLEGWGKMAFMWFYLPNTVLSWVYLFVFLQ